MGPQAEMIANAAEERGEDTPETYIPPEVPEGLEHYIQDFWRLSSCRGTIAPGYPAPIPWTAVDEYTRRYRLDEDEIAYDDFVFIIDAMDQSYLNYCREVAARNGNSKVVPGSNPSSRSQASTTGW